MNNKSLLIKHSYEEYLILMNKENIRHAKERNDLRDSLLKIQKMCNHEQTQFVSGDEDSRYECLICGKYL